MPPSKGRKPATLRSIAEATGVHPSTVSRILNSTPEEAARAAGTEKVEAVKAFAKKIGYRPNPHATSLKTNRSNLIGVLVPRLQDFVLATIYEGIVDAADALGYSTFVTNTMDKPETQIERAHMMLDRRVDGLIFGDARSDSASLKQLAQEGITFVLVSRHLPGHISVTTDDYQAGRLVGEHLLDIGRTNVGILAGSTYASTAQDRTRGVIDKLSEAGIRVPPEQIIYRGFDAIDGRLATEVLLSRNRSLNAVFATNDFAAIGALGVLRDYGMSVPQDIALIGYNDVNLVAEMPVPLTTIRSPMHEMGYRALEVLDKLLAGEDVPSQKLTPELIIRQSTDITQH